MNKKTIHRYTFLLLLIVFSLIYSDLVFADKSSNLDSTFSGDGIAVLGSDDDEIMTTMTLQSDGKVILAGILETNSDDDFIVAKVTSDGIRDLSFGSSGTVITDINNGIDILEDVVSQDDGKIIAVGYTKQGDDPYVIAVVRYNPDGTLDASFGETGIVLTDISDRNDFSFCSILQSDQKIVVGGATHSQDGGYYAALIRYNTDGSLDTTFNGSGIVVTDVGGEWVSIKDIHIQEDGKIIAGGVATFEGGNQDFVVVRYYDDGSIDHSFGTGGIVVTDVSKDEEYLTSIALQPDGKIILIGSSIRDGDFVSGVRYYSDGTLDTSFGEDGILLDTSIEIAGGAYMALQPNGKFMVASSVWDENYHIDMAVFRYDEGGNRDLSFGDNGMTTTKIFFYTISRGIEIQPDGKVIVGGYTDRTGVYAYDFAAVRFIGENRQIFLPLVVVP